MFSRPFLEKHVFHFRPSEASFIISLVATGDLSPDETHLRRLKMKNRFFKNKNLPILSKKLKLLRKVKVFFRPSVTFFFSENLMKRGSL